MSLILDGTNGVSDIDGSASTPAIRGTDANTGIFFPAADTIAFSEGGSEIARFDSSGNLGIGTVSPSQKLDVTGNARLNASSSPVLQLSESGTLRGSITGSSTTGLYFQTFSSTPMRFDTDGLERMRITAAGNLQFNSGYGSVATAYGCRAWVNFNGTGTPAIRASGNVSSVTDSAVGIYYINFTTSMPDANYAVVTGISESGAGVNQSRVVAGDGYSAASALILTYNVTTLADYLFIQIAVFR
jgi:hypothetical protein